MFESVNIRSSVAVYVQIENLVQCAVASGQLKPGDQLPSMRELAEKVGVNMNTVAKAYRDLEVMGIIYTRRGMGVFVNEGAQTKCREHSRQRITSLLHEVTCEAKAAGVSVREIKEICEKSFASNAGPYAEAPKSLLALAKAK